MLIRRAAVSDLLALHRKVNDKETIVGWCVTRVLPGAAGLACSGRAHDDYSTDTELDYDEKQTHSMDQPSDATTARSGL